MACAETHESLLERAIDRLSRQYCIHTAVRIQHSTYAAGAKASPNNISISQYAATTIEIQRASIISPVRQVTDKARAYWPWISLFTRLGNSTIAVVDGMITKTSANCTATE